MRYATVLCFDDLTRDSYWPAKEFIYDLIRVPVFHAAGLDLGRSPRRGQRNNLRPGFDVNRYLQLCREGAGLTGGERDWAAVYRQLPAEAAAYLCAHVPDGALVVGYELTPALRRALSAAGHAWLDIRLSPLRFASDLILALDSNDADLKARLLPHTLRLDQVFAEAALMAAQVRYRQRYDTEPGPADGAWVWVGQTEADASLIDPQGHFVRLADHAATLRQAVGQAKVLYQPHPLAPDFAAREQAELERVLGRRVSRCTADTYELLAGERPVSFIGLSSGVLQEAQWFGKPAVILEPPVCLPGFGAEAPAGTTLQVAAHEFLSEPLWASLLHPEGRRAEPLRFPPRPNHLRELHNTWWGYAPHVVRHSEFFRQAVALHGGAGRGAAAVAAAAPAPAAAAALPPAAAEEMAAMRHELLASRQRVDTLRQEVDGLKQALQVVLRQCGPRAERSERQHQAALRVAAGGARHD